MVCWQIANSGIDLKIIKSPGGAQTITVTRREGGHTVSETITTRSPGAGGGLASGPKRPRIESNYRKQFESQVGLPQSLSAGGRFTQGRTRVAAAVHASSLEPQAIEWRRVHVVLFYVLAP